VITIDDVNRAKEYLIKQELEIWTTKMNCVDINWVTPIQLDNLPCPAPKLRFGKAVSPIQKEQQMNCYQTPAYNEVQQAKQHLNQRVENVRYYKDETTLRYLQYAWCTSQEREAGQGLAGTWWYGGLQGETMSSRYVNVVAGPG
jgi:hypothetical protein